MTSLLAVETSSEVCSIALSVDGHVYSFFKHAPMKHAELLLPAISELLNASGLVVSDLDAIAFGRGPGSFTSLRIGIGVVQGLAWGAGLPVIPVSSLAAVAQQAVDHGVVHGGQVCVAMDARMNEVYTANFRVDKQTVRASGGEHVCSPEQLAAPSGEPFIAAGNGFERFEALAPIAAAADACFPATWPRSEAICHLAFDWLKNNDPLPVSKAQPSYVRNDVASKPKP
jgi:tRNA threonylcarbamoyladenosine biosynthesis protein TsaB